MTRLKIVFAAPALKQFLRLDKNMQRLIRTKLDMLAAGEASLSNNIKALKGSNLLRLRVGNYRVIYTQDGHILMIVKVGHRRDVYV